MQEVGIELEVEGESEFASQLRRAEGQLGKLGDAAAQAREDLNSTFEGGSEAALGFAAVVGGTLYLAFEKFLEQDKRTQESLSKTGDAFDELVGSFVHAATGGDGLAKTFDAVTVKLQELTTWINDNRNDIAEFGQDALYWGSYVLQGVTNIGGGIVLLVSAGIEGVQALVRGAFGLFYSLVEEVSSILYEFPSIQERLGLTDNDLTRIIEEAREGLRLLGEEGSFETTTKLVGFLENLNAKFDDLRQGVDQTTASVDEFKKTAGEGGGGGGANPRGLAQQTSDNLFLSAAGTDYSPISRGLSDVAAQAQITRDSLLDVGEVIGILATDADEGTRALQNLGLALGATEQASERAAKKLDADLNSLANSAVSLGIGLTDAFLAFAVGANNGGQLLQTVLSNVGNLAGALGSLFLFAGIGSEALPFLGLSGAGAVGAGLGLLGLAAGLKATSSYLGASGAGGGGGGGNYGPSLASGAGRTNPGPTRSTRSEDRAVNLVLQDGTAFRAYLTTAQRDDQRRLRVRGRRPGRRS